MAHQEILALQELLLLNANSQHANAQKRRARVDGPSELEAHAMNRRAARLGQLRRERMPNQLDDLLDKNVFFNKRHEEEKIPPGDEWGTMENPLTTNLQPRRSRADTEIGKRPPFLAIGRKRKDADSITADQQFDCIMEELEFEERKQDPDIEGLPSRLTSERIQAAHADAS